MKKILSIICVCAMLVSLCACGNPDKAESASAQTQLPEAETVRTDTLVPETELADTPAQEQEAEPVNTETSPTVAFNPHIYRIQGNAWNTYVLNSDGTLTAAQEPIAEGDNVVKTLPECLTWTGITNFSSNSEAVAAVLENGTVVMCGGLVDEMAYSDFSPVSEWKDVVQVAMGKHSIVALKADGSIEIAGDIFTEDLEDTTGFVQVEDGCYPMGVKADGTVVVWSWYWEDSIDAVKDWTDIVSVSCTWNHIVALKGDGTVVACGNNDYGQCDVSGWTDIVAVSAGLQFTMGLKADGTVVACGDNGNGQCDVGDYADIVEIDAGYYHGVGIKSDGTVMTNGANWQGQCDIGGYVLK